MTGKTYEAAPFSTQRYALAEAPFWDERTGVLSFVDIPAGQFIRIFPGGEQRTVSVGRALGAAVPGVTPGTYVLAAADGLYLFAEESLRRIVDLTAVYYPWQRSNDAKADPRGRLFFGSVADDDAHGYAGDLFRLDGVVRVVQPGTKIANGMAWDRARRHFYFSDSQEHGVFVYDYDEETGGIANRRLLFPVTDGVPDGMCIDAEDRLWLAVWDGRRIEQRSAATGELLAVVRVPAQHVSSCCFMDEHSLLITSGGEGLSGDHDGKLFTCRVDAPKGETHPCAAGL